MKTRILSAIIALPLLFFVLLSGGSILKVAVLMISLIGLNEFFNPLYSAFVCAVVYLALYGFIHTEAIIDVVDAWFASYSGKDAYKIMKESTIGAIGALYGVAFVLLKV